MRLGNSALDGIGSPRASNGCRRPVEQGADLPCTELQTCHAAAQQTSANLLSSVQG